VRSTVLAVSAVLLALAFASHLTGSVQALPPSRSPTLSDVSQAGGESATGTALSHSYLTPTVVYIAGDGHIHEIALKGTWQDRDLTAAAGAPVTALGTLRPMAYRRSEGVSMVVYRGQMITFNPFNELASNNPSARHNAKLPAHSPLTMPSPAKTGDLCQPRQLSSQG
jgi:hypothetical protein